MKLFLVLPLLAASLLPVQASYFTGIYARIDRVVLKPNVTDPDRAYVWGVFSLADPDNRAGYLPPARGYLYFRLDKDAQLARNEWTELKSVAGTGEIVAFGARYQGRPRLRKADEKPGNPDPYSLNVGVHRMGDRTDYAPVRALLDYKD